MKNKTRYCIHNNICDREEDCKSGEQCDWFESNPDTFTKVKEVEVESFKDALDKIWNG